MLPIIRDTVLFILLVILTMFVVALFPGCAPTYVGMRAQELDAWHKSLIIPDAEILPLLMRMEAERDRQAVQELFEKEGWRIR